MPDLPRAMTSDEHEACCNEADEILRAWLVYEHARSLNFKHGVNACMYARALERDWHDHHPRHEWTDFCDRDQLAELNRLEHA